MVLEYVSRWILVVVDLGGILVRSTENDFYIEIMKYINNKM